MPAWAIWTSWRRLAVACVVALFAIVLADLAFPPPVNRAQQTSIVVTDRDGYWLHAFATDDGRWRFRADLDKIDPALVRELVAIEDKRFWRHHGVDVAAVVRAASDAVQERRIVSGASTITMQTARLLDPRERTLGAKLIEMVRAAQLERRLSKREILELYLTLAPYGGNIEGVRAASLIYFNKEPSALTPAERALLIALPQAPEARRPDRRPQVATEARNAILARLANAGLIDDAIADDALGAPTPHHRNVFPRIAYHASHRLAANAGDGRDVYSTLSASIQQQVEAIISERAKAFTDGATAAAMVIDNASGEVLASVGSSGLDAPGGWIDLTDRQRSRFTVETIHLRAGDGRRDFEARYRPRRHAARHSGYNPDNFDRTFRGEVRVRDALQHSLNVPAVETLDRIGSARFSGFISSAGAHMTFRRRADARPTLAMALGGGGLTMREIGVLYTGLANNGSVRPLRWTCDEQAQTSVHQLFSETTAAQINAILRSAPALAGRAPAALSAAAPDVAFKTGTSYGFRDAWAAGHADGKTIIVWVGRADGAPRPGVAGRTGAAPLLFDLFDALSHQQTLKPADQTPQAPDVDNRARLRPPAVAAAPVIKYPVPGSEIFAHPSAGRGVALAAAGGEGDYRWYVDGVEIPPDNERAIWRPAAAGFYDLTVVDARGYSATAKVRVASLQ
ncbi:MAG: transglycosylase domain-containing protein [Parvularculaceae bacterium]